MFSSPKRIALNTIPSRLSLLLIRLAQVVSLSPKNRYLKSKSAKVEKPHLRTGNVTHFHHKKPIRDPQARRYKIPIIIACAHSDLVTMMVLLGKSRLDNRMTWHPAKSGNRVQTQKGTVLERGSEMSE